MATQTLLVLLGGLGLTVALLSVAAFLPKARFGARWTLRGLASIPLLLFGGLIAGLFAPRVFPPIVPYEDLGTFETTDLQGRPCSIDVQVKYLSYSIPPGMLPRLHLVARGVEGQDSLTYDTGWRFGVYAVRPVPGGIEVFWTSGGIRFAATGSELKIEKEHILATAPYDLDELQKRVDPESYRLMKLIGNVSGLSGGWFDPGALLRAVNALQRAGKEKAAATIRSYFTLRREIYGEINVFNEKEVDALLLILRLLFVANDKSGAFPPIEVGLPDPIGEDLLKELPNYPLVLFKGIPFVIASHQGRYAHDRPVEDPLSQLQVCLDRFTFRSAPLAPEGSPLEALEALQRSPIWERLKEREGQSFYLTEGGYRLQALMAVSVMDPTTRDEYNALLSSDPAAEQVWQARTGRLKRLNPSWDAERQDFFPVVR